MQAHLLIDGYNVILGLPHLEKIFQRDKEQARDELGRIARNIHDADAVRVTIVSMVPGWITKLFARGRN